MPARRAAAALRLALAAVLFGAVFYPTLRAARLAAAEPAPSADFGPELRRILLEVQPDGENAWPLYERAAAAYCGIVAGYDSAAYFGLPDLLDGDWRDPRHTEAKRLLGALAPVLEELHVASLRPACVPDGDSLRGVNNHLRIFTANDGSSISLLDLLRPNAADIRDAAHAGDWDRVLRRCDTGLRAAAHAALEPSYVGRVIANSAFGLVLDELRLLALEAQPPAEVCEALIARVAAARIEPVPRSHFLRGARLDHLDALQRIYSDDGRGDGVFAAHAAFGLFGFGFPDDVLTRLGNIASFAAPRRATLRRATDRYFDLLSVWADLPPDARGRTAPPVPSHALPAFIPVQHRLGSAPDPHLQSVVVGDLLNTEHAATILALRLLAHRARHGVYPACLDELDAPPGADLDPTSGMPFVYTAPDASAPAGSFGLAAPRAVLDVSDMMPPRRPLYRPTE